MVEIEELEQILHDEEMAVKRAKSLRQQREITKQEAEDKLLFNPIKHWTGLPATVTDVARSINPPHSKILEMSDASDRMVNAHALGFLHGMYLRLCIVALLGLVYVYG
jgi:hypothetical protein